MLMKYINRITDKIIKDYLAIFGAVIIEGPKWCGKTSSGKQLAKSIFELTASPDNINNKIIAENNISEVLEGPYPRLIDEWQEVPAIWDAARHRVDESNNKGLYIFAGSSTPNDNLTIHSGAGRFGRVRMSTMSLAELGISSSSISLRDLLYGQSIPKITGVGQLKLDQLIEIICRGGWPGLIGMPVSSAQVVLRNYVDTLANEDVSRVDGTRKDPAKVSALMRSLSRNIASLVSKETISRDIDNNGRENVSISAMDDYLDILRRVFVYQEIPAWDSAIKSTVRLRSSPKRTLVDPSLAVASLGADPIKLKNDLKFVGSLFEAMVLRDLMIYASANDAEVSHYNDNSDLEVDAIISGIGGAWGAVEIKLSYTSEDEGAKNLLRLKNKIDRRFQPEPRFLAVITGIGSVAHIRDDGVFVIPIDQIGA